MVTKVLSQSIKATRVVVSSAPRYATFFVNTGCNRRCVYCVVPEKGSGIELPVETWQQITDRVASWGVHLVSILGGEPTLRKDLPEIISYASKKLAVSLTSNGDTFVGAKGRERLKALASGGLSVLNLSLHDFGDLDRQLDILQFARKLGVIPSLGTVATGASIGLLPAVMKATNERGVLYRYLLYQDVGGSFSSVVAGLAPTPEQVSAFVAIVEEQQRKTHLIQVAKKYMIKGTNAYPRGWHCDVHADNWVVVDNEGKLMACSEYPTQIPILDIATLKDPRWIESRTAKRTACSGCSYQCYMDAEMLTRSDMVREAFGTARGLFQSRKLS